MSCCANRGSVGGAGVGTAAGAKGVPPDLLAHIADTSPAARASFAGGRSHVGTDRPEIPQDGEGPVRPVRLKPFEIEVETVTNARFAAFVAETGYVTEAEWIGWSPVFRPLLADPESVAPSDGATPWWGSGEGACWYEPEGPGSSVAERADHPVVQVSWADANAFATWVGGRLPSEAEWEHAARGGLDDPRFPWGDREPDDADFLPANIWQGDFPRLNTLADGYMGTAPVRSFTPNGAGIYQMSGNVWEWTADPYRVRSSSRRARARNDDALREREKVLKGGSFLCHRSYCYRYRIAARSALPTDSCASNCGFRVAYDPQRYPGASAAAKEG